MLGDNSLVCRLCFQTTEKLGKLKEEVTAKEAEVVGSYLECEEGSATYTVQPLLETFNASIYHSH